MSGERNYLRLPPDSTGKRISIKHNLKIYYVGKDVGINWDVDGVYTLASSGMTVTVHDWHEETSTSGWILVILDDDDRDSNKEPTKTEAIKNTADATVATVASTAIAWEDIYQNQTMIVGGHPEHELEIDYTGSANVRFAEGQPQLDAFGKLRISNTTLLGEYVFSHSALLTQFSSAKIGGSATVDHNSNYRCLELTLDTDATNYNTFGYSHYGLVSHTSNTYHHYTPGVSQLLMTTVALGDDGVSEPNLTRTWGYNDAYDGVMFMLQGSTLGINIRSSLTGATPNLFIPQSQWNGDKLDGTGPSKMVLDVTKDNVYWMDMQWLGSGSVRFGVYHNGNRITCHTEHHDNKDVKSYMRTGSLAACQSMMATAPLNGSTYMRTFCISVFSEANLDHKGNGSVGVGTLKHVYTSPTVDQYYYVGAFSPQPYIQNDVNIPNHSLYFVESMQGMITDQNGTGLNGELEVYYEPVLGGVNWATVDAFNPFSTIETDVDGTYFGGGSHVDIFYVKDGYIQQNLHTLYGSMVEGAIKNYSCDGGIIQEDIVDITATTPPVVTVNAGQTQIREVGEKSLTITGVSGMTQVNGGTYYPKMTGVNSFALYEDAALTTPVNGSGWSAYTSGGVAEGFRGSRVAYTVLFKPFQTATTVTVRLKMNWKEIIQ